MMRRTHSFLLLLTVLPAIGLGCTSDRRGRAVFDSGGVADGGTMGDSSIETDAEAPVDSARPPADGALDSAVPMDSGSADTGVRDTGVPDTGPRDTGTPDTGRPDTGPPPPTIADIQRGTISPGTMVSFTNMSVTAVFDSGAWVQDPALGPTYSGIRVYVGAAPGVAIGDRVDVEGSVLEFFGDTEIEATSFIRRGGGTPLSPVPVTVSQAASEPYEGVLVRLTDASSYESYYDCTLDNPACGDTDVWRVSSSSASILVHDFVYEDIDWLTQIGDLRITGIASYRFDGRRIQPRRASDLAP